ncbi:hypothetical protein Agub_g6765, partial [Astrephomene gubernaculifera]
VVDRTPPTITLLDTSPAYKAGQDYSTVAGTGRITYVLAGSNFVDPGARVVDDVDGDITASLARSYPSGYPLDTHVPRDESNPFVIAYTAWDSAGNVAVAFRRVYVVCPEGERVCSAADTSDGVPTCSVGGGICGTTITQTSSNTSISPAAAAVNTPPVLTLLGKTLAAMVADGGGGYGPCMQPAGITDLCDPGVTAVDAEDGNLGPLVRACGEVYTVTASIGGVSRTRSSLAACSINTAVPGDYVVNYTVSDSGGAAVWAVRTLRVCPQSEYVCSDNSCSQ